MIHNPDTGTRGLRLEAQWHYSAIIGCNEIHENIRQIRASIQNQSHSLPTICREGEGCMSVPNGTL